MMPSTNSHSCCNKSVVSSRANLPASISDNSLESLKHSWNANANSDKQLGVKLTIPRSSPSIIWYGRLPPVGYANDKLIKQLQYTAESATDLSKRCQKIHHRDVDLLLLVKDESQSPIDLLRDNLTFDSAIFCHALRLGITLSIGFICYRLTDLPMDYWITLSIMFVLKPNLGRTFVRFFQRVDGTLLGAAIAAIWSTWSGLPVL
jgi:Fusaric acid resistance protein-like